MTFNNGAPETYVEWIEQNHDVTPCLNKQPIVKGWTKQENYVLVSEWKKKYLNHQVGLILNGKTDFDIDNHFIKRFVGKHLKSCGAIYGRKSNPLSHYLFKGELTPFKYTMPKELENYTNYCKLLLFPMQEVIGIFASLRSMKGSENSMFYIKL